MALPLPVPPGVVRAVRLGNNTRLAPAPAGWNLDELRGRLTEISGLSDSSCLTHAFGVVLDAQHHEEPVVWVTRQESTFFPLDAWCSGVDLNALVVVRLLDEDAILRATDRLARSGGFGLVVADLSSSSDKATALGRAQPPYVPMAAQARLRGAPSQSGPSPRYGGRLSDPQDPQAAINRIDDLAACRGKSQPQ